jgi:EpsD family peptidyl-prolyl cis-trans isomerase
MLKKLQFLLMELRATSLMHLNTSRNLPGLFAMLLLASPVLVGCNSKGPQSASQVAAKINAREISVHQINNQLANAQNIGPDEMNAASRNILERLIDQEVLVQQATKQQLDRSPGVMQAIEAAKRELITRAYIENLTTQISKPQADEIESFYQNNPALFAERRIYTLRELRIVVPEAQVADVQARANEIKDIDELVPWLSQSGLEYTITAGAKAAEEFPIELLSRFAKLKDGDIGVVRNSTGLAVLQLISSITQPLTEKQAHPLIENILMAQKKSELVSAEIKRLREAAKIEYVGEFARDQVVNTPNASSQSREAAHSEMEASASNFVKGVSKLK